MKRVVIFLVAVAVNFSCKSQMSHKVEFGSNGGKYVKVKGSNIYYEEYGKGTPLLLLHGGLSSIKGFSNVIPELSQHFRVLAIDAPGNGRSEQADSVSLQLMADYYSDMIDQLKLDSVYVYGYSLGGITALHLAADRPEKVKRVVAHSVSSHLDGYNEAFAGTPDMTPQDIESYARWWLEGHLVRTPQPTQWRKYILDLKRVWYPRQFISDNKLQSIKSPLLIIQGDRDLIKYENAIHMHSRIAKSELCILPNTTHFSLWENPELTLQVITPFLRSIPNKEYTLSY